jgi:hypothetical protein
MLQETKKTHKEIKTPQISIPRLADYMAASEQARRTIVQTCKYRAIARVVQHNEAKAVVSDHILDGTEGVDGLKAKAEQIRKKLADDDFEADVNDHNADYIERFAENVAKMELPKADRSATRQLAPLMLHGVRVTFYPQLMLQRVIAKTNKIKIGALMLRYAKGKPLAPPVGAYQSAAIFGYVRTLEEAAKVEAERGLCITLDAYSCLPYEAPTNSIYLFKEMTAACETIFERWPAIKPPKNAVF